MVRQLLLHRLDGKTQKKKKEGFITKKEAMDFEHDFIEMAAGQCTMKFASIAKIYLDDCKKRVKYSTYVTKKSIMQKYIIPFFEDITLDKIMPANIRQWQSWILENNVTKTNHYLRNINNQLSSIFNFAQKYYDLDKNPVKICGAIGNEKHKKILFWTLAEFKQFVRVLDNEEPLYTIYNLLFWTGIRRGELLALRPKDFNFAEKTLSITRNLVFVNSRPHLNTPKTDSSKRVINIPDFMINIIKKYIDKHKIDTEELLFKISPYFLAKNIIFYSQKAKIHPIKIHDFRHSHASMLIEQGFSPLIIAQRLGHKDVTTTLKIYAHLYPSKQQELAEKLHNLYKENIL